MAWVITGYDGGERIFEHAVADLEIPETEIAAILQRLASRHLSCDEVLLASLPHGRAHAAGSLDITREATGQGRQLSTTGNPYYVAQSDEGGAGV